MIHIETGIMSKSAFASNEKYEWTLSIRKVDDSSVGEIARKHKEQIDSQYLRDYLPGWENIQWEKLNKSPMFLQEFGAECGDYRLNIILSEKNTKPEDCIANEFVEFMQL